MSFYNPYTKEMHCKIVYYGPSLGGKTTNLQWIYHKTVDDQKNKLIALNAETERTRLFDFLPLYIGEIHDIKTKFHLFSVPGQLDYDERRKLVLRGIDGVVFVADSQMERWEENIDSMNNLEINLRQQGYDIKEIPLVLQYNKRDLKNVTPVQDLRKALNRHNWVEFESVVSQGVGVFESLNSVGKYIINILKGGDL